MEVISWIINLLLSWYVWIPAVLILSYLTWRNYRQIDAVRSIESTLLILEIPKANDKQELAAEQLFASLHGILRDKTELKQTGGIQEHLSFEIASVNGQIRFYVWVPTALRSFVEGQIYSQYPTVQIHEADEDYVAHERNHSVVYTSEITLTDSEFLPIKTFQNFEVDPLAGITGTLAKLETTGEELWVQVLVRPIADDWHKSTDRWIKNVKSGGGGGLFGSLSNGKGFDAKWFLGLLEALWRPPEQGVGGTSAPPELSDRNKTRISEAETKATKLGYQVKIRLAYLGDSQTNAKLQMQAIVGTFKQFNSTNLNGFKMTNTSFRKEDLERYRARLFTDKGYILNIEEVASVFHLPHTNVETPNIVWASSKTAEPPAKLPVLTGDDAIDENISAFGLTNFRGINHQFGMLRSDRSRHMYIIGQTGAGKSGTLALLALSDIFHNQGYAIIDPHGDFAIDNMRFIPASRLKDVVYFNPADTAYPLGFNPLEVTDPNMKSNISSEVIGVLERMFSNSWGPRLEYILRYTILALLDRPETTMLDITRMLTDKKFRKETLSYCKDTVVLQFWNIEFNSWTEKFQAEAIAPILNKVGAFTANPIIRNIIGQPKSTFNIRQMMDEGKILIVNLSKGLLGEDNSSVLGSFLVTKIQLAAMSRSDIPNIEDRRPFYLYVDEFQNFATDSFATILSEARKYGLNLTVANQYISQMSETVRDAVFGNVGTMVSFRVSADDAPILSKQFEPQFEANDLLQMHNRNFIINMVIRGEKAPAFSARTLQLPPPQTDNTAAIIEHTRANYSKRREDVEAAINSLINPPEHLQRKGPGNPKTPAMAKQWPIDAGARPSSTPISTPVNQNTGPNRPKFIIETPAGEAAISKNENTPADTTTSSVNEKREEKQPEKTDQKSEENKEEQPKKKRSRNRRKKTPQVESNEKTDQKTHTKAKDAAHAPSSNHDKKEAPAKTPATKKDPETHSASSTKPANKKPETENKHGNDDTMGLLKIR
ncbi:type IV secretion system DNA-binding domain-containing protein [Candidatus Saccharibacteria bacterium]|nr:type IV secretion system DNA-binding domain-containing protein [Candidatus Saccharibacteria bacterium]